MTTSENLRTHGTSEVASAAEPPEVADVIAAAVLAHPAVVRLDGGAFGTVASHLPGRRVVGVRVIAGAAGPDAAQDTSTGGVEVAVVARLGRPLPAVVAELRDRVRQVAGAVPVDVMVSDVVIDDPRSAPGPAT